MLTRLFLNAAFAGSEWVLWLLLIVSCVSLAIIVERLLYFARNRVDGKQLANLLDQRMRQGDVRAAWELVSNSEAIECAVVAAGLSVIRRGAEACSEAMLSAKSRLRGQVEARLPILGTIGANAAFVGLLGTVLGIIRAAHDLTSKSGGQADPTAVMAGVFEALIATAVGLGVAIPAVVAFNFFQRKVRGTMAQVDALVHQMLTYAQPERKTSPPPAQAKVS
jgi:biopolymer transport protein ExbB